MVLTQGFRSDWETGPFGFVAVYAFQGRLDTLGPNIQSNTFEPTDGVVPDGSLPGQAPGGVLRVYDRISAGMDPNSFDPRDTTTWVPDINNLDTGLVAELVITPRAEGPPFPPYLPGAPLSETTIPIVTNSDAVNSFEVDLTDAFLGVEGDIKLEFTDRFDITKDGLEASDSVGNPSLFKNLEVTPSIPGYKVVSHDLLANLDQEYQATNFPTLDPGALADAGILYDGLLDVIVAGDHMFSGDGLPAGDGVGSDFDNMTFSNNLAVNGDTAALNLGAVSIPGGQAVLTGSIHGFKFKDQNANGIYEPADGDTPWAGFPMELTGTDGFGQSVGPIVVETDDAGEFWFTGLIPGTSDMPATYTVREVTEALGDSYMPSTSSEFTVTVSPGEEYVWRSGAAMLEPDDGRHEVPFDDALTAVPGNDLNEEFMIGNFQKGSVHGFKFEDHDADGVYEPNDDDAPLAGIPFVLIGDVDGDGQEDNVRTTTDDNGEFWFENLWPGDYTVREVLDNLPDYFMPSTPIDYDLTIRSGQEYVWRDGAAHLPPIVAPDMRHEVNVGTDLMFGNFVKGSIHGFKFEDHDADGVYEPNDDDAPLAGIPFVLIGGRRW